MTGVHLTALAAALISISVIVELLRRRALREKYAVTWLAVSVLMIIVAVAPGLFNRVAHGIGVANPPDLLAVLAVLFLLVVVVHLSWEIGRLEDRSRSLAEEVALLRKEMEDRVPLP